MPNTLAHYGVQALGTRLGLPRFDVRWLLLGPVIPDLPWIGQRIHMGMGPILNPYDVRLYAMIQASLLFCLLLSGALALVSERPKLVFGVLAVNSLAHLLLDAVEIKWANGVHLLAPFSWKLFSGNLVWAESPLILGLTGLGLVVACWLCFAARSHPIRFQARRLRVGGAGFLFAGYLFGPLPFLQPAERSGSHYIATLRELPRRNGRPIELERTAVIRDEAGAHIRTYARETIRVANPEGLTTGTYSIRGRFVEPTMIYLERVHRHTDALRQGPTYLGLLLLGIAWIVPARSRRRLPDGD